MKILISMVVLALLLFRVQAKTKVTKSGEKINKEYAQADKVLKNELRKNRKRVDKFRPKACPLISTGHENLVGKFKAIQNSLSASCVSSNKGAIDQLGSSITGMQGTYNEYRAEHGNGMFDKDGNVIEIDEPGEGASQADWDAYALKTAERDRSLRSNQLETEALKQVSGTLDTFSKLAQSKDCKEGMSGTQVLSMMSDVISQTSSMGMLAPGPTGYLITAGGMGVSSILKIISELFKSPFDWKDRDKRDSFLKLNCSFFELKKEIDSVGLLHVKIKEHNAERRKKRDSIKKLKPYLNMLRENEAIIAAKKRLLTKSLLYKRMGPDNYTLYNSFNDGEYLTKVKSMKVKGIEEKGEFLGELYANYNAILKALEKGDVGKMGRKYTLPGATKQFKAQVLGAKNEEEFIGKFINNQGAYTKLMANYLKPLDWAFEIQKSKVRKNYIKAKGFAQVVRDPLFKHKLLVRRYENIIEDYETRIKFLNNINSDTAFSPDDNGTRIKNNIITNFREIQEAIYGKVGASFTKYVMKTSKKDLRKFDKTYKSVEKSFKKPDLIDKQNRFLVCSNAKELQLLWGSSHALLNIGYDFMEANKDSFYKPKKRFKMFLFVPVGKSDQRWIKENAETGFMAADVLQKNARKSPQARYATLSKIKMNKDQLGYNMIKLELEKPKLKEAQRFSDKFRCHQ
jgi:hypothetical protein